MERLEELKGLIGERLHRASQQLMGAHVSTRSANEGYNTKAILQERVALLGQLIAGLSALDAAPAADDGAAYGSAVTVQDLTTGETREYMLMVGELVNIDAGQVSLGSPVGRALAGRHAGETVTVATPTGERQLHIVRVVPLCELLASFDAELEVQHAMSA